MFSYHIYFHRLFAVHYIYFHHRVACSALQIRNKTYRRCGASQRTARGLGDGVHRVKIGKTFVADLGGSSSSSRHTTSGSITPGAGLRAQQVEQLSVPGPIHPHHS